HARNPRRGTAAYPSDPRTVWPSPGTGVAHGEDGRHLADRRGQPQGLAGQSHSGRSVRPADIRAAPAHAREHGPRGRTAPGEHPMTTQQKVGPGALRWLRDRLAEPRLATIDVDGEQFVAAHRAILFEKRSVQQLFLEL